MYGCHCTIIFHQCNCHALYSAALSDTGTRSGVRLRPHVDCCMQGRQTSFYGDTHLLVVSSRIGAQSTLAQRNANLQLSEVGIVAGYDEGLNLNQRYLHVLELIQKQWPFWARHNGSDHMWSWVHDLGYALLPQ